MLSRYDKVHNFYFISLLFVFLIWHILISLVTKANFEYKWQQCSMLNDYIAI